MKNLIAAPRQLFITLSGKAQVDVAVNGGGVFRIAAHATIRSKDSPVGTI